MKQINELKNILINNFNLTSKDEGKLLSEEEYLRNLRDNLSSRILFFIRTDMDKLFHALYRVDVDESLVHEAFNLSEIHLVSRKIAELIIERQLKKLSYHFKYTQE